MLPLKARLLHALLAVVLWSGLALGAWMEPSEKGHGTHRQLGLPPCSWMLMYDMPCPSCGMTTAVSNAAHGRLWTSFRTQPAGATIAVLTSVVAAAATVGALFGSPWWPFCSVPSRQVRHGWPAGGLFWHGSIRFWITKAFSIDHPEPLLFDSFVALALRMRGLRTCLGHRPVH